MFDEGSGKKSADAACGAESTLSQWFCCWDTVEALARDAGRLHEKCGPNCGTDELGLWRERVMAQLEAVLAEEKRIFGEISSAGNGIAQAGSPRPLSAQHPLN